jgi:uncharacterized membrane protein YdjX (TVP38/TMEM64 family)
MRKSINGIKLIIILLLIIIIILLAQLFSKDIEKIGIFLRKIPAIYSAPLFISFYVLSNFVFFFDIKDLLKPVAALIFGAYISTLLIYIAEIINAFIFFNLSSILGRNYVERALRGKFSRFYEKLENINLGWIVLFRLLPFIPYRVLDISFGLSRVPFKKYIIAVILASPPRIFWIQIILASVGGFYPEKIMKFYQDNPFFSLFILLYLIISVIFAFSLRKKLK